MTQPTATLIPELIVRLADAKYALGQRFSQWTTGAPTLEAAVAAAAMTQDELGHARSLYAMLQNVPDSPEAYLGEEKRGQRLGPAVLDRPFDSWAEFVAASALVDRALTLIFQAARPSRYEPLRQRAAKILQEEHFHRMYGEGWVKRLASASRGTRAALQAAVDRIWRPTVEWLDSSYPAEAVGIGVMAESASAVRARWSDEAKACLTAAGLSLYEQ